MTKSHEILSGLLKTRDDLKKLKDAVDPASGMSVGVRRGVLSDAAEDDDGRAHREWITLEICEDMPRLIDDLIERTNHRIQLWVATTNKDIEVAKSVLDRVEK